jgi:UDP-glucose 4-epimerase
MKVLVCGAAGFLGSLSVSFSSLKGGTYLPMTT